MAMSKYAMSRFSIPKKKIYTIKELLNIFKGNLKEPLLRKIRYCALKLFNNCEYNSEECPNIHPICTEFNVCADYFFGNNFCRNGKYCSELHISQNLGLIPCIDYIKYGCCNNHKCSYGHFNMSEVDRFKCLGLITSKYWAPDFSKMCFEMLGNPFTNRLSRLFVEIELIKILYQLYYSNEVEPDRNVVKILLPKRTKYCFERMFEGMFVENALLPILYSYYCDRYEPNVYVIETKYIINAHKDTISQRPTILI